VVNLPNSLTVARIFLVPLLVIVLLTKPGGWDFYGLFISKEILGAAIFTLASVTDWLDGYLARRRKQITAFGQWMDPLADKLLVTAALLSLVQMDLAQAWMVAIILFREFAVTVLRSVVHARGQSLPASPMGKIKLIAQVVAIVALILGHHPTPEFSFTTFAFYVGNIALWLATIAALVSAIEYSRRLNSVLGGRPGASPPKPPQAGTPVTLAAAAPVVTAADRDRERSRISA